MKRLPWNPAVTQHLVLLNQCLWHPSRRYSHWTVYAARSFSSPGQRSAGLRECSFSRLWVGVHCSKSSSLPTHASQLHSDLWAKPQKEKKWVTRSTSTPYPNSGKPTVSLRIMSPRREKATKWNADISQSGWIFKNANWTTALTAKTLAVLCSAITMGMTDQVLPQITRQGWEIQGAEPGTEQYQPVSAELKTQEKSSQDLQSHPASPSLTDQSLAYSKPYKWAQPGQVKCPAQAKPVNSQPTCRLIAKKTELLSEPDKAWMSHGLRVNFWEEKLHPTSNTSRDDHSEQKHPEGLLYHQTFYHLQEFENIMFSLVTVGLHILEEWKLFKIPIIYFLFFKGEIGEVEASLVSSIICPPSFPTYAQGHPDVEGLWEQEVFCGLFGQRKTSRATE